MRYFDRNKVLAYNLSPLVRKQDHGEQVCSQLSQSGHSPEFSICDITSTENVKQLAQEIKSKHGGLDILINNSGILDPPSLIAKGKMTYSEQVARAVNTNFFGTLNVCNAIFPLLRPNARVVNVSSRLGVASILEADKRNKLLDMCLTENELVKLMTDFIESAANETLISNGWPEQRENSWNSTAYSVSKLALTLLSQLQARLFTSDERCVTVNAVSYKVGRL